MPALAQYAAELSTLVREGRRIRFGDRDFEKPHADLDALLGNLTMLADRMRVGASTTVTIGGANDGFLHKVPAVTLTGRGQVLHAIARRR